MASATGTRWSRAYGASGWHLVLMVASLGAATYVVLTVGLGALWDPEVWWQSVAVWFVGALVVHDLVLFPAYALLDSVLRRGIGHRDGEPRSSAPALVNHVRVPSLAAGLLFLMFFPGILQRGGDSFGNATGLDQDPFLGRWLALAAAGYVVSGVVYAVRRATARSRSRGAPGPAGPQQ